MNPEPDDVFGSTVPATPTVASALIRVGGDIDRAASAALSAVADRLDSVAPARVVIDLADQIATLRADLPSPGHSPPVTRSTRRASAYVSTQK